MIEVSIGLLLVLGVAALAMFGPNILHKARHHTPPNDALVKCHCSAPDCDRYAYIDLEYLHSDQTARQNCHWGIEPTRCPDHRNPTHPHPPRTNTLTPA